MSPRVCTYSEISCKNLEGQEGLRQLIFHVTCNMKDVGSTIGCQKLAGRLVSVPARSQVRGSCFPLLGSTLLSPFAVRHMSVFKVSSSRWEQGRISGSHNSPGMTRSAVTLYACPPPEVGQSHALSRVCSSNAVKTCPPVLGP